MITRSHNENLLEQCLNPSYCTNPDTVMYVWNVLLLFLATELREKFLNKKKLEKGFCSSKTIHEQHCYTTMTMFCSHITWLNLLELPSHYFVFPKHAVSFQASKSPICPTPNLSSSYKVQEKLFLTLLPHLHPHNMHQKLLLQVILNIFICALFGYCWMIQ